MTFIELTYDDSQLKDWFLYVKENQFLFAVELMQKVAYEIEGQTRPLVPFEEGDLERSFKYTFIEKSSEFVEVEIGYDVVDPKSGFAYAEYQHEEVLHHPQIGERKGERLYLTKGIRNSRDGVFVMIEKDYMSLFKGASR